MGSGVSGAHVGGWRRCLRHSLGRALWYEIFGNGALGQEDAEHETRWVGGAGGEDPCESLAVKLLTDGLKPWPAVAARRRRREIDTSKALRGAQIGDLELTDRVGPHVSRKRVPGRHASLGEVSIPLGPDAIGGPAEIERVDDLAALPAVVIGRRGACRRIDSRRSVPKPPSIDGGRLDVERHELCGARRLESGNEAGNAASLPAGNELDRPVVVERLDWLQQPHRDVLGIDHVR
jgi:hypothetical protein